MFFPKNLHIQLCWITAICQLINDYCVNQSYVNIQSCSFLCCTYCIPFLICLKLSFKSYFWNSIYRWESIKLPVTSLQRVMCNLVQRFDPLPSTFVFLIVTPLFSTSTKGALTFFLSRSVFWCSMLSQTFGSEVGATSALPGEKNKSMKMINI